MKNIKYHHDHDQLGDPTGEDRDGDLLHPVHALHHQGRHRLLGPDKWCALDYYCDDNDENYNDYDDDDNGNQPIQWHL